MEIEIKKIFFFYIRQKKDESNSFFYFFLNFLMSNFVEKLQLPFKIKEFC